MTPNLQRAEILWTLLVNHSHEMGNTKVETVIADAITAASDAALEAAAVALDARADEYAQQAKLYLERWELSSEARSCSAVVRGMKGKP